MIQNIHPGSWSRFVPIPDPGVKKAPDPGSGSATLLLNDMLGKNVIKVPQESLIN